MPQCSHDQSHDKTPSEDALLDNMRPVHRPMTGRRRTHPIPLASLNKAAARHWRPRLLCRLHEGPHSVLYVQDLEHAHKLACAVVRQDAQHDKLHIVLMDPAHSKEQACDHTLQSCSSQPDGALLGMLAFKDSGHLYFLTRCSRVFSAAGRRNKGLSRERNSAMEASRASVSCWVYWSLSLQESLWPMWNRVPAKVLNRGSKRTSCSMPALTTVSG